MKRCLICEKEISVLDEFEDTHPNLNDAGFLEASFGYGSGHDQLGARGFEAVLDDPEERDKAGPKEIKRAKLLRAKQIIGYICDDCFEKKLDFFEGFRVERTTKIVPVEQEDVSQKD